MILQTIRIIPDLGRLVIPGALVSFRNMSNVIFRSGVERGIHSSSSFESPFSGSFREDLKEAVKLPKQYRHLSNVSLSEEEDLEMAGKWDFFSDHLMVAANILGTKIGSLNVFNSAFAHHVKKDCWKNSYYMKQDKELSRMYPGMSLREEECVETMKALLLNGSHSLDVLCIQECSDKMFNLLRQEFANFNVQLFMTDGGMNNHVVTIVKPSDSLKVTDVFARTLWTRKYVPPETRTPENPKGEERIGWDKWRQGQGVGIEVITPSGKLETMILMNVHISCAGESIDYRKDRCNELAEGLKDLKQEDATVVVLGDFNTPGSEFW